MGEGQAMVNLDGGADVPRRGFMQGVLAGALGVLAGLIPLAAGLGVFLDPLRRRSTREAFVKVTRLTNVPPDGVPRRFVVLADQVNAWNRRPNVRVGAVFLRRTGESDLKAFNVTCPHAGCSVEYAPGRESFLCPCHDSTFALDGTINDPGSPSPRGLDELAVEVRNDGEVWVRYQNFLTGVHAKVAV